MTSWKQLRKNARQAGIYAAEGGPDRRREFDNLNVVHDYDEGFQSRTSELEAQIELDRRLEPLRSVQRLVEAAIESPKPTDVDVLAIAIKRVTEYLIEEELGNG